MDYGELNPRILITEDSDLPAGAPSFDIIRDTVKRGNLNSKIGSGPYLGIVLAKHFASLNDLGVNQYTYRDKVGPKWLTGANTGVTYYEVRIPELDSSIPMPNLRGAVSIKTNRQSGTRAFINKWLWGSGPSQKVYLTKTYSPLNLYDSMARRLHPVYTPEKPGPEHGPYEVGDIIWVNRTTGRNVYLDLPPAGRLQRIPTSGSVGSNTPNPVPNTYKPRSINRKYFVPTPPSESKKERARPPKKEKKNQPAGPPPPPLPKTKTELELWDEYTGLGHKVPKHMRTLIKTEEIKYANGKTEKITLHKDHMPIFKAFVAELESEIEKLISSGKRISHSMHRPKEAFRVYVPGGGSNRSKRKNSAHNSGFALDWNMPREARNSERTRKNFVNLFISIALKHNYKRFGVSDTMIHLDLGKTVGTSGASATLPSLWWVYNGGPKYDVYSKKQPFARRRLSSDWYTGFDSRNPPRRNPSRTHLPAFLDSWQASDGNWL